MPLVSFKPEGAVRDAFSCHDPELIIDGPAGTGKSYGLLWLMHIRAMKYPGSRHLVLRKWRTTLTQSALITYRHILQPDPKEKPMAAFHHGDQQFTYANRSVVVVGGLDKSQKVMSTEYDTAYIQEATETEEKEWEDVSSRMRYGAMPYQQITGDCNPSSDRHWVKQRWERGVLRRFQSHHTDNPVLWDKAADTWTQRGREYIGRLDLLTGVRLKRLRWGLWVSAEGMVYEDEWDSSMHVIPRFHIPRHWTRIWTVDFGFNHPFVWQAWAINPDGRLFRVLEIYHTGKLVEDHARDILELCHKYREPKPRAIVCDHDLEDRKTLERHLRWTDKSLMPTIPAYKAIMPGIQAVKARLRPDGTKTPRLLFLRNAVDSVDPKLREGAEPACTEEEMESYVWDTNMGRKAGELPMDKWNHGCDAMRYAVAYVDELEKVRRRFTSAASKPNPAFQFKPR